MIEAHELTKRYGDTTAVHSLSFTIAPGTVTGFLGPNGAGKSTTMRMIMGLDRPTSGTVTVNGKPYRQHRAPLREVGALLEASAVHPGRSARSHLRTMAATHNIKASRVSEVIKMTGLAGVATKRVGGFSLGMGQRLASPPPSWATPGRSSSWGAGSAGTPTTSSPRTRHPAPDACVCRCAFGAAPLRRTLGGLMRPGTPRSRAPTLGRGPLAVSQRLCVRCVYDSGEHHHPRRAACAGARRWGQRLTHRHRCRRRRARPAGEGQGARPAARADDRGEWTAVGAGDGRGASLGTRYQVGDRVGAAIGVTVLVLDSSGLSELAMSAARLAALREQELWPPQVPAVALTQALTGDHRRDFAANRLLHACQVRDVSVPLAREAADLRTRTGRAAKISAVDALVVAFASGLREHAVVLTSDGRDIRDLAAVAPRPVTVLPVHPPRRRRRTADNAGRRGNAHSGR